MSGRSTNQLSHRSDSSDHRRSQNTEQRSSSQSSRDNSRRQQKSNEKDDSNRRRESSPRSRSSGDQRRSRHSDSSSSKSTERQRRQPTSTSTTKEDDILQRKESSRNDRSSDQRGSRSESTSQHHSSDQQRRQREQSTSSRQDISHRSREERHDRDSRSRSDRRRSTERNSLNRPFVDRERTSEYRRDRSRSPRESSRSGFSSRDFRSRDTSNEYSSNQSIRQRSRGRSDRETANDHQYPEASRPQPESRDQRMSTQYDKSTSSHSSERRQFDKSTDSYDQRRPRFDDSRSFEQPLDRDQYSRKDRMQSITQEGGNISDYQQPLGNDRSADRLNIHQTQNLVDRSYDGNYQRESFYDQQKSHSSHRSNTQAVESSQTQRAFNPDSQARTVQGDYSSRIQSIGGQGFPPEHFSQVRKEGQNRMDSSQRNYVNQDYRDVKRFDQYSADQPQHANYRLDTAQGGRLPNDQPFRQGAQDDFTNYSSGSRHNITQNEISANWKDEKQYGMRSHEGYEGQNRQRPFSSDIGDYSKKQVGGDRPGISEKGAFGYSKDDSRYGIERSSTENYGASGPKRFCAEGNNSDLYLRDRQGVQQQGLPPSVDEYAKSSRSTDGYFASHTSDSQHQITERPSYSRGDRQYDTFRPVDNRQPLQNPSAVISQSVESQRMQDPYKSHPDNMRYSRDRSEGFGNNNLPDRQRSSYDGGNSQPGSNYRNVSEDISGHHNSGPQRYDNLSRNAERNNSNNFGANQQFGLERLTGDSSRYPNTLPPSRNLTDGFDTHQQAPYQTSSDAAYRETDYRQNPDSNFSGRQPNYPFAFGSMDREQLSANRLIISEGLKAETNQVDVELLMKAQHALDKMINQCVPGGTRDGMDIGYGHPREQNRRDFKKEPPVGSAVNIALKLLAETEKAEARQMNQDDLNRRTVNQPNNQVYSPPSYRDQFVGNNNASVPPVVPFSTGNRQDNHGVTDRPGYFDTSAQKGSSIQNSFSQRYPPSQNPPIQSRNQPIPVHSSRPVEKKTDKAIGPPLSTSRSQGKKICFAYQKNNCRYGDKCHFLHAKEKI